MPGYAEKPIRVVTTLSTFADIAQQIGGENVAVSYVALPRFNPHFIEPKPSDVLKVKNADLFIHAGLDLEAWRGPLLDAAGNTNLFPGGQGELDLSRGINLLEVPDKPLNRLMGDIHIYGNPHYWTNPENGKIIAQEIAEKLSETDPNHALAYQQRLSDFTKRLDTKMTEWKTQVAPLQSKEVIAYHNEWPYLAEFCGIKIQRFLEPKPGIPPSPKQLAFLKDYIQQHGIKAIIQSTYFPKNYSEALSKQTGARVVILCQNVKELPEASDYIAFVDYNIRQLVQTLGDQS